jgi:multicomponent Na+:H+ antiporter subunit F
MVEATFGAAAIWVTFLLAVMIVAVVRAKSAILRILLVDTVTLILVALLVLFAERADRPYYLDAALALAMLSFVGTVGAARYLAERRVF